MPERQLGAISTTRPDKRRRAALQQSRKPRPGRQFALNFTVANTTALPAPEAEAKEPYAGIQHSSRTAQQPLQDTSNSRRAELKQRQCQLHTSGRQLNQPAYCINLPAILSPSPTPETALEGVLERDPLPSQCDSQSDSVAASHSPDDTSLGSTPSLLEVALHLSPAAIPVHPPLPARNCAPDVPSAQPREQTAGRCSGAGQPQLLNGESTLGDSDDDNNSYDMGDYDLGDEPDSPPPDAVPYMRTPGEPSPDSDMHRFRDMEIQTGTSLKNNGCSRGGDPDVHADGGHPAALAASLQGSDAEDDAEHEEDREDAAPDTPGSERPRKRVRNSEANQRLRKLYNQRRSLSGQGLEKEDGRRRSTRERHRPLEYWRNERKVYSREFRSLPTVHHIETRTPEPGCTRNGEEDLRRKAVKAAAKKAMNAKQ
ncbi:hypothetical protein WJX72_001657 [[Myrmecia] bisecta]|uniref:Uncharacterized protein n=1 Tax=[Myrmecia] bisecta TaxID=41462 RepID=A0AAW1PF68_9CHLO